MSFYFSEKDWDFKQAELARHLERRRLVNEARAARKAEKLLQKQSGMQFSETKKAQQLGKETLGWN